MWSIFKKIAKKTPIVEERAEEGVSLDDILLKAIISKGTVSLEEALEVPAFGGCVNKICDTASIIPIKLYKKDKDGVVEVDDDRVRLLNNDTKDVLSGADFKKALVRDYLTNKGGYAFINRRGSRFLSLNYVEADKVSFLEGWDPIFKDYKILIEGREYEGWQFLKVCRHTKNGYSGYSVQDENNLILTVAYTSLKYEGKLAKRGGNKKGFLESERKLDEGAVTELKEGFNRLYSDDNENAIVLNNGVKFHESSNTSVEMQVNENKKANSTEICKIFGMPPEILAGGGTELHKQMFIQYCIIPVMRAVVEAVNRDLLLEIEKGSCFFDFDVSELTKADIKTRYEAYAIGYKNRFLQIEEIRAKENLPDIDIPYFMLGMNDVLYDPATGDIFMPNLNQFANVKDPDKFPQTGSQNQQNEPPAEDNNTEDDKEEEKDNAEDESNDQS